MKKPEDLTKQRAENLSKETLQKFFEMVSGVFGENGLTSAPDAADRIFNCDETGCTTNPNQKKMFFKKTSKDNFLMTSTCGKAMFTILFAGCASGEYLPPLVVYKVGQL